MIELKKYREAGLSLSQIHEIEEGYRHGLKEEQVALYDNGKFDPLQMQEIRLGLQEGLNEEKVRFFARETFDHIQMNHIRTELMNQNLVDEHARSSLFRRRIFNVLRVLSLLVLLVVLLAGGMYVQRYRELITQPLVIELMAEEIDMNYGDTFMPMDYVRDYSRTDDTVLDIPEMFTADFIGDTEVVYTVRNREKAEEAHLIIHVKDLEAPQLVLTNTFVRKERTEGFDPVSYIGEAYDNVDGEMKDRVVWNDVDSGLQEQTVTYTLTDSSGNRSEKQLKLQFYEKEAETKIVYIKEPWGKEKKTEKKTTHGKKTFLFKNGYTMDSAYTACVVFGKKHVKYSCEPIRQDGVYTGYRCVY